MSPPIYTPDGSEVSEIVLPDGSTASQVIGPDGNVVFEAGPDIPDTLIDRTDDNQTGSSSDYIGAVINPNVTMDGIKADISDDTTGASSVHLFDSSTTEIDSVSSSGSTFATGSEVVLNGEMTAGEDYYLVAYESGNSWYHGRYNSPSFPYEGDAFDIPLNAILDSVDLSVSTGTGFFYALDNFRNLDY